MPGRQQPPVAAIRLHEEVLFGTTVRDPYRWMEEAETEKTFSSWAESFDSYTREILGRIPPRSQLLARLNALSDSRASVSDIQRIGQRQFYLKRPPNTDRRQLFVRDLSGRERSLLDPASSLGGPSENLAIDYYKASPNGRYVVVGLSANGSEDSVLRVLDTRTGRMLSDTIDRAMQGWPHWRGDNASFYYKRLQPQPRSSSPPSIRYQKQRVYLHALGTPPDNDQAVFGYDVSPSVAFGVDDIPFVTVFPSCPFLVGLAVHGLRHEFTIYVAPLVNAADPHPQWRKVADVEDSVVDFAAHGRSLYLLVTRDEPKGRVVRLSLDDPDLGHAETVLPASEAVVSRIAGAQDALYVRIMENGIGRLRRVPYDGPGPQSTSVPLPYPGSVSSFWADDLANGVLFRLETWTRPAMLYLHDSRSGKTKDSGLLSRSPLESADYESEEVIATSTDGTSVPLSIVHRRGLSHDGKRPTLLSVYGSYGESWTPEFAAYLIAWLERGGVFAVAHVRGGGELGEAWHQAAIKQHKQRSTDDLIACARYLIARQFTSPSHLAVEGTSAGGIPVAGAITQHPEMFAAAVIQVGIVDTLGFERTAAGRQNAEEFGTAKVKSEFLGLYQSSAYYHVQPATPYPAVLFTCALHDARVPLWQPGKMAARLQAATSSGKPILFRVEREGGHGITQTSQFNEELADSFSFLLWQLGHPDFQPPQ